MQKLLALNPIRSANNRKPIRVAPPFLRSHGPNLLSTQFCYKMGLVSGLLAEARRKTLPVHHSRQSGVEVLVFIFLFLRQPLLYLLPPLPCYCQTPLFCFGRSLVKQCKTLMTSLMRSR